MIDANISPDAGLPPRSAGHRDLEDRMALAIVSRPRAQWLIAGVVAVARFRAALDDAHPDVSEELRQESADRFARALLARVEALSFAGDGSVGRA